MVFCGCHCFAVEIVEIVCVVGFCISFLLNIMLVCSFKIFFCILFFIFYISL